MDLDGKPEELLPLLMEALEDPDGKSEKPRRVFTPEAQPGLRELWEHRGVVRNLALWNLRVKYQRSVFGFLWTLLNPLVTVMVLIAVFSLIIRLDLDNYWAFLVSGYFVWNFIQQALFNGTYVLEEHAMLSRSVALPSEVPVIAASLAKFAEFLVEIVLVTLALLVFHQGHVNSSILFLPVALVILYVMALGFMFPVATVSVLFKDVKHALPLAITTLFYLSPVFYPVSLVPEAYRTFYYLNPFAGMIQLFHVILYEGQWPSLVLLGSVSLVSALVCVVGYRIFNRYRYICVELV